MADVTATIDSERAVRTEADAFELLLKPEYQDALRDIVEHLPKLATVMGLFGKFYDVSAEALSDPDLMGAVDEIVRAKAEPWMQTYSNFNAAVKEAKERAEADTTQIGVFGVLRMLKDPVVQKNLKLVSAFLSVWAERTSTKPVADK
ncbi:DUF1641 domain-containing protein [Alicyclobacillus curvatus]|nr:DUF1641 domain-containing protein [Alicyclobacillus curvatus]